MPFWQNRAYPENGPYSVFKEKENERNQWQRDNASVTGVQKWDAMGIGLEYARRHK